MKIEKILSCECEACCPTVFLSEDGDLIVMGKDVTNEVENLSQFGHKDANERLVKIPRSLIENLKQ